MKRSVALAAVILICVVLTSCPKPRDSTEIVGSSAPRNPQQAAERCQANAQKAGIKIEIAIRDVNNNGLPDFVITYLSGHEGQTQEETIGYLLGHLTSNFGSVAKQCQFKTDLVILKIYTKVFQADSQDCVACLVLYESGASGENLVNCIENTWKAIDKAP